MQGHRYSIPPPPLLPGDLRSVGTSRQQGTTVFPVPHTDGIVLLELGAAVEPGQP